MSLLSDFNIDRLNKKVCPGVSGVGLGTLLNDLDNYQNPSGRVDYYVNGNRADDTGDGLTWATAKKTLVSAIALSNANIALDLGGWAARNRIFCKGDALAEDLTVLPNKCDVIGVGSHNANPMCTLEGVQTIGAGAYMGTRFINMRFFIKAAGGDLFTVPTTTSGLAFHHCVFDAHNTVKAGGAIVATASLGLKIMDCRFMGEYSDAVIELGTGAMDDCVIQGNYIEGLNKGIEVNSGLTMAQWQGRIQDNTLFTTLACIDDASSKFALIGNRGVTLAVRGQKMAGAVVGNIDQSLNNIFTCADGQSIDWPIKPTLNPSGGRDYYVSGNSGHDTNNTGSSWEDAYATVAVALAASHASIAAGSMGWAARNRVFISGDSFVEDLTKLAQKTDIIGVGSCGHLPAARIQGNHSIDGTAYAGCRWINVMFRCPAGGGDIITLPTTSSGNAFIDCYFDGNMATPAGGAIIATGSTYLTIRGCTFDGPYSDAVIELGAGDANQVIIENNKIHGADIGIDVNASFNCSISPGYIKDNVFQTTLACVNDAASKLSLIGNRGITLAAKGASLAGAVVGNVDLSVDNKFSCSDANNVDWPALGTI